MSGWRTGLGWAWMVGMVVAVPARAADDLASRKSGNANWSAAAGWNHSNPAAAGQFPHNGNAGLTYDVVLGANGITTLDRDVTIESLRLDVSDIVVPAGAPATLTIVGGVDANSGFLSGPGKLVTNGGLVRDASSGWAVSGWTLDLHGTSTWSQGAIVMGQGAVMNQHGTFLASANAALEGSGSPVFNNFGTFRKSAAGTVTTFSLAPFHNQGTTRVEAGTLRLFRGGSHTGQVLDVAADAAMELRGGTFSWEAGRPITGAGSVVVDGGRLIAKAPAPAAGPVPGGPFLSQHLLERGRIGFASGELVIEDLQRLGVFDAGFRAGTIKGPGELEILAGGRAEVGGGNGLILDAIRFINNGTTELVAGPVGTALNGGSKIVNNDSLLWRGGTMVAPLLPRAVLENHRDVNVQRDSTAAMIRIDLVNQATVFLEERARVQGLSKYVQFKGETILSPGSVIHAENGFEFRGGKVEGTGTFVGDMIIGGEPGGISGTFDSGTGVLTLTGSAAISNYMTALRQVQFGDDGTAFYGQVRVGETMTFGGTLSVEVSGDTPPKPMQRMSIFTYESFGRRFDEYRFSSFDFSMPVGSAPEGVPDSSPLVFAPVYGPKSLDLVLTFAGDATLDGRVGFEDLVVLAQNYGASGDADWVDGDFSYDLSVGFEDLVLLAQNYNTGVPVAGDVAAGRFGEEFGRAWGEAVEAAGVPEPAAGTLLAAGAMTLTGRGWRRRGRLQLAER